MLQKAAYLTLASILVLTLPGCPSFPTKEGFPGPYVSRYTSFSLEDGSEVSLWYPESTEPLEDLPLIVFSTGWNQVRKAYFSYARQLSQWGYVVATRFYPSMGAWGIGPDYMIHHVDQVSEIIDWCEIQSKDPASPFFGMIDAQNVATTGHSMGGHVSVVAATLEPRIRAVVTLDGNYADHATDAIIPGFDHVTAPMLFIGATDGGLCSRSLTSLYSFYDAAPSSAMEVMIEGADHMDFMDGDCAFLCQLGRYVFCASGTADDDEVRTLATRYMIAWFNMHLKGLDEYSIYINGSISEEDEQYNRVAIRRK